MTFSTALSGTALRVLRTAVGRRALQIALLVGGLCALGFLFGGQARAVETTTSTTSTTSTPLTAVPVVPLSGADGQEQQDDSTGASSDAGVIGELTLPADPREVLRPVTEHIVGSLGDTVVQPVADLVETVTEELARGQLPSLPSLPGSPESPSSPTLPEPSAHTLPAPVDQVPQRGEAVTPPTGGHEVAEERKSSGAEAVTRSASAYGPFGVGGSSAVDTASYGAGHRAAQPVGVPAHREPAGDSDGALGDAAAVDSGAPRHGDAHAVTPHHQVPLWLVAGGAVRAEVTETRDRYRDIPVFPA